MSAAPARHPRPIPPAARTSARTSTPRARTAPSAEPRTPGTRTAPSTRTAPNTRSAPGTRTAPNRRAQAAQASTARPHLRAVAAPEQARSLVPFAWLCAIIVVSSLAAVLLLNTSMASGAYERRDLKIETATLHEQRATLITQLEQRSAPEQLGSDARALGMQPAERFGFLSLADKVVIESGSK